MTISVNACAKINLALDVLGLRPDGFHNIDTVYYEIDLADRLELSTASDRSSVVVHEGSAPADETNLALRAVMALAPTHFFRVDLWKKIPAQAGLGGGSSDAAAVLNAVKKLIGYSGDLGSVALQLGSDVPFFLAGGCARALGRGEVLTPVSSSIQLHLLLVKPDVGVSTAWAYRELDLAGYAKVSGRAERVVTALKSNDRPALLDSMGNDFQSVVASRHSQIALLIDRLKEAGSEVVILCGSGSAVVGVFPTRYAAETAKSAFSDVWSMAASGVVRETAI